MSPSTPSTSDSPIPPDVWGAAVIIEPDPDEPIVGVVTHHPIPSPPMVGFDFGPGGKVYIGPIATQVGDGGWKFLGYADGEGFKFNDE